MKSRLCRKSLLVTLVLVALVALAAVCIPHVGAAAPGREAGQILFFSQRGGEDEIWVMNADGSNKSAT